MSFRSRGVGIGILLIVLGIGTFMAWKSHYSSRITWQPTLIEQRLPYKIELSAPTAPQPGESTTFTLTVQHNGEPDDLLMRGVLAHVTVVSANGRDMWFYHTVNDLLEVEPGVYTFTHTLTEASPYTLWIELNDNTTSDHHGDKSDYIGRIDLSLGTADTPAAPERVTSINGEYTLHLAPLSPLTAEQSGRVTITATDHAGHPVPLLTGADHYIALTGPDHYELWHFDVDQSTDQQLVTSPLTFPTPGTYNVFARIFSNSGTVTDPEIGAELSGVFTLQVP